MEYHTLGTTGLKVSSYPLVTMLLSAQGNTDHDQCERMIHPALDAGLDLVDTADVHSSDESEAIVGKVLAGRRRGGRAGDQVPLPDGRWPKRRRQHAPVDPPRRRGIPRPVSTDWIDLYQIHRYDPAVDLAETLGALTDRVRRGLVRHVGCSTFAAHIVAERHCTMRTIIRNGRVRPVRVGAGSRA